MGLDGNTMFERELTERKSRLEWPMVIALLGLMVVGAAFIFSAAAPDETARAVVWYRRFWFRQVVFYVFGTGLAGLVCFVEYHRLARWSLVFYWASITGLVLVLFFGKDVYGARRWIDIGFTNFQPSEVAKIAFILALANFLSRPPDELRLPTVLLKALGMTMLPFLLIMKEPDLGSALVFLPVCLAMAYVAGVPASHLRRLVGGAALVVVLIVLNVLYAPPKWRVPLQDYQRHRLLVYFGKDFAPRNANAAERQRARELQQKKSYNVEQALISVGSGGLTGKGWRQGTQNALGYLPRAVAHNDFIFSVIAEEKGFVGSVTVLTLYTVILFSGIKIAGQARDRLGKLLAVGVVTLLFSHLFINIGMNIRMMPVTGIPLPLLSYGGTSVVCSLIAAGILQNVYLYRRSY